MTKLWYAQWAQVRDRVLGDFTYEEFLRNDPDPEHQWLSVVPLWIDEVEPWDEKNASLNLTHGFLMTAPPSGYPVPSGETVYIGHEHIDHDDCYHDTPCCPRNFEEWMDEEVGLEASVNVVHLLVSETRLLFYLSHSCGRCGGSGGGLDEHDEGFVEHLMEKVLML